MTSDNIIATIGSVIVNAKGRPALVAVNVTAATEEFPARVRITRDMATGTQNAGKFIETVGYIDRDVAETLANLLLTAAAQLPVRKVTAPRENGPVTVRRGRPAKAAVKVAESKVVAVNDDNAMGRRIDRLESIIEALAAKL